MLRELKNTSQIPNESRRRWFSDNTLDLIVWYDTTNSIKGFQFCYGKGTDEHALTWFRERGYSHNKVDDGERPDVRFKMTPVLVPDGNFNKEEVLSIFKEESSSIDGDIVEVVTKMIKRYPKNEEKR